MIESHKTNFGYQTFLSQGHCQLRHGGGPEEPVNNAPQGPVPAPDERAASTTLTLTKYSCFQRCIQGQSTQSNPEPTTCSCKFSCGPTIII